MNIASISGFNPSQLQNSSKARVASAGSLGRIPFFYDIAGDDDLEDMFELSAPFEKEEKAGQGQSKDKTDTSAQGGLLHRLRDTLKKGYTLTKIVIL